MVNELRTVWPMLVWFLSWRCAPGVIVAGRLPPGVIVPGLMETVLMR
jgi:hypothetical protein